jgi:spore maturation protein CgeB
MGFLERNLRILKKMDRPLAREVEKLRASGKYELVYARNGSVTMKVNGYPLHSIYDPQKEAQDQVKSFTEAQPGKGSVFVLGLGLGYHVTKLLERTPSLSVVIIEPDGAVFRRALESVDLACVLEKSRGLYVGKSMEAIFADMEERTLPLDDVRFFIHPPSMKLHQNYFDPIMARLDAKRVLAGLKLKILVVPPVYGGSLPIGHYCLRALNRLGHHAIMVDNSGYHPLFKEVETITSNRFHQRQLQGSLTQHLSEIVMAKCLDQNPDVILALAQAPLTPDILDRMREFDMVTAFWFVEDFRELTYWKEVAERYSHFFAIQNRETFEASETLKGIDFHYLPLGCDPSLHKPMKLNATEKLRFGSEVSFVGAGYYNRQMFFEGLLDFDFRIWGTEWDWHSPVARVVQEQGRRVTTREAAKIFNGSAININLHSSTYHRGINPAGDFVNPRTFEIASCRGFQLVDPRSHLADLFEPDQEVVCFDSIEDLREKITYYLSHREARETIALKGQKRARRHHTYEKRMTRVLEVVVEKNLPRFTTLKKRIQTPEALIAEAGAHTELAGFLSRFKGEGPLTLETIVSEIKRGEGKLTEPEVIFLLMHEFSREKTRRLKELCQ